MCSKPSQPHVPREEETADTTNRANGDTWTKDKELILLAVDPCVAWNKRDV